MYAGWIGCFFVRHRFATSPVWFARSAEGSTMAHLRRDLFRHRIVPALAALAFSLTALLSGEATAQGVVKSVHGDWQIRCDTPPGAQSEQCALVQSVTAEDRPNVGLTVIVLK